MIRENKWTISVLVLGALALIVPITLAYLFDFPSEIREVLVVSSMSCFPIWFIGGALALNIEN